ncbi:MAG: DUF1800 domain-containing protein [Chlorobi bacterium]|nr:DUF1800 domain-containing protein [Chlorobiota bacterium]
MDNLRYIHHLLNRASFGPSLKKLYEYEKLTPGELTDRLFASSENYTQLNVIEQPTIPFSKLRKLSEEEKRKLRMTMRKQLMELNKKWFMKMATTDAVLREKLTLFWHDHFACYSRNPYFAQDLNNILRKNALGNFGQMLFEVSKSPAMLQYLNNQQNKAKSPNENFAREVLELFTLGRGNYTETDIKNAARAFTGWGFNIKGEFVFREKQHDYGTKQFQGYKGNLSGEDVLNIILEKRQTAYFITKKIFKYFVNEEPDNDRVNELAESFYASGYDLRKLMMNIFSSPGFYDEKNINALIKSPAELLVGYARILPFDNPEQKKIILAQRALGQILFMPPNVGGWPYGKEWINTSSITYRLQMPYTFIAPPKNKNRKKLFSINWQEFNRETAGIPSEYLAVLLLGNNPGNKELQLISRRVERVQNDFIRKPLETVSYMSLPEYQLA